MSDPPLSDLEFARDVIMALAFFVTFTLTPLAWALAIRLMIGPPPYGGPGPAEDADDEDES